GEANAKDRARATNGFVNAANHVTRPDLDDGSPDQRRMVRPSGVEPPLLSEHGPEPCASANSATGAHRLAGREISRPRRDVNRRGRRPALRWPAALGAG